MSDNLLVQRSAISTLRSPHLVMPRETDPDNRMTHWSVHSIEQRTGISRPNATTHRQRNKPI
jgi:hypothetical protein